MTVHAHRLRPVLALALLLALPAVVTSPAAAADRERHAHAVSEIDTASTRTRRYDEAAEASRLEAIGRLEDIVASAEESMIAEASLRLAELYTEEGRYLYLQEVAAWQDGVDRCSDTPGCDPARLDLASATAGSRRWYEKSIKIYRRILTGYPQYERADAAAYYLGQALLDTGHPDDANEMFTRLVKTWPQSSLATDAYLRVGEYWFDRDQPFKAIPAYQRAAAVEQHEKFAFASYKLAWCYYQVGEYDPAITTMERVVDWSLAHEPAAGAVATAAATADGGFRLQDEALKDLVRFFADADEADRAERDFYRWGKEAFVRDLYTQLGAAYAEQGKQEKAIDAWRRLIAADPAAADAPMLQDAIVRVSPQESGESTSPRPGYASRHAPPPLSQPRPSALPGTPWG